MPWKVARRDHYRARPARPETAPGYQERPRPPFAQRAKRAIERAGGIAFEVRTAAPSDFITSGGHRGGYILSARDGTELRCCAPPEQPRPVRARAPGPSARNPLAGYPARPAWVSPAPHPGASGADEALAIHGCFLRPVLLILDRRLPPEVASGPRSSMGPQLVLGLGTYSGCCCHITRSNSLPSGSANVVCDTLNVTPPARTDGMLSLLSGLAPRPVSRSISSS